MSTPDRSTCASNGAAGGRFKITANGWVSRAKPNGKGYLGLGHIARLLEEQTPTGREVQRWWAELDDDGEITVDNGNPCPATPLETETGNGQRGATP